MSLRFRTKIQKVLWINENKNTSDNHHAPVCGCSIFTSYKARQDEMGKSKKRIPPCHRSP